MNLQSTVALILLAAIPKAYGDNNAISNVNTNSSMGGAGGMGGSATGGTGIGHGGQGGTGGSGGHATGGSSSSTATGGDSDVSVQAVSGNVTGGNSSSTSSPNNSQAITYETVRQSPSVFLTAPHPTAVCQGSLGFFATFIGGLGFSTSHTLEECEKRETARVAFGIDQPAIAKQVLCMTKFASQTTECKPQGEINVSKEEGLRLDGSR